MNCTHTFNGVSLSEDQFNKLVNRAVEVIKNTPTPYALHADHILSVLNKLNINELNENTLADIVTLNETLADQYDVDQEFIKITDNGIEINHELINQVNSDIEAINKVSPELIESTMNDILFAQPNELTGYTYDPIKENRFITTIKHKESLLYGLEKQKNEFEAKKAQYKTNMMSDEYGDIIKTIKEIDTRINGRGFETDPNGYIPGLRREITALKTKDDFNMLYDFLLADETRLDTLSKRNDNYSISESRKILNFFEALKSIDVATSNTIFTNPIFTDSDLIAPKTIIKINIEKFKKLGERITNKYTIPVATREVELLNALINEDPHIGILIDDLRDKVAVIEKEKAKKANVPYVEKTLSAYDVFFKLAMKDINWWDAHVMNGVIGTFSDFGPMMQIADKLLQEKIAFYEGQDNIFSEKMTELIPKVNAKLKELGHGIVLGLGVSYNIFRQKYRNGKKTLSLISRHSAEYNEVFEKVQNEFKKATDNIRSSLRGSAAVIGIDNANFSRVQSLRKMIIQVDPRKIKIIKDAFPEFSQYFIDDNGENERELKANLNSNIGYDEVVSEQLEQVKKFKAIYRRIVKSALEKENKTNILDLSDRTKEDLDIFITENNPFIAAKYIANGEKRKVGLYFKYPNLKYNTLVPRRKKANLHSTVPLHPTTKELQYVESNEETGFYDDTFPTIENDQNLYAFWKLSNEMMETKKYLPLEQQNQLRNNVIAGKVKSFKDIILDPDVRWAKKLSPAFKRIHDNFITSLSVLKTRTQAREKAVDVMTNQEESEISLGLINTYGHEIDQNMIIAGTSFIQTLDSANKTPFLRIKEKQVQKGYYKFTKHSKIGYNKLSPTSKLMLSKYLEVGNSDSEILTALGVSPNISSVTLNTLMVDIGRIIYRDVIDKVVENETFNLPQALKIYSAAVALYAGRNAARPIIDVIKKQFKTIPKANTNNVGEFIGTNSTEERSRANKTFDLWFNKHVLGNLSSEVIGVAKDKVYKPLKDRFNNRYSWISNIGTSSLTYDEKIIVDELQKLIDHEDAIIGTDRNQELINALIHDRDNIGRNFSTSAILDRVLDLIRMVGLALNPKAGISNIVQGKTSNFINASSGQWVKESSWWRGESIAIGSIVKGTGISRIFKNSVPKGAKKIAIMMKRMKLFQDSSNEIHKASLDSAVANPTVGNIYFFQNRTEYINQAPILAALLIDTEITGKDGTVSNVWDALNEDAKLTDNFATDENKLTWEAAQSKEAGEFIIKATDTISMWQGDYSRFGKSVYSNHQWFKVVAMFKTWVSRQVHTRFSINYYDLKHHIWVKGRYRSLNAASGLTLLGTVAATLTGFGLITVSAMAVGAILGKIYGVEESQVKKTYNDPMLNTLAEIGMNISQIVLKSALMPVKLAYGLTTGKQLLKGSKINDYLDNGHRNNKVDAGLMNANLTEASLIISTLMIRLILKAVTKDRDEDEDDAMLNIALNMCGRTLNDLTLFYNPLAFTEGMAGVPLYQKGKDIVKLSDTLSEVFGEGSDIIVTGVDAGDSKTGKIISKLIFPSLFRTDLGFGTINSRVFDKFGFEDITLSETKRMETLIDNSRAEVKEYYTKKYTKMTTPEMVNTLKQQILKDHPDMKESLAKRKAIRILDKQMQSQITKKKNELIPTLKQRQKIMTEEAFKNLNIKKLKKNIEETTSIEMTE